MSLPRISRTFAEDMSLISWPISLMLPVTRAFLGSRPRSAIELTDLPEPDSPTMARTSPAWTS